MLLGMLLGGPVIHEDQLSIGPLHGPGIPKIGVMFRRDIVVPQDILCVPGLAAVSADTGEQLATNTVSIEAAQSAILQADQRRWISILIARVAHLAQKRPALAAVTRCISIHPVLFLTEQPAPDSGDQMSVIQTHGRRHHGAMGISRGHHPRYKLKAGSPIDGPGAEHLVVARPRPGGQQHQQRPWPSTM